MIISSSASSSSPPKRGNRNRPTINTDNVDKKTEREIIADIVVLVSFYEIQNKYFSLVSRVTMAELYHFCAICTGKKTVHLTKISVLKIVSGDKKWSHVKRHARVNGTTSKATKKKINEIGFTGNVAHFLRKTSPDAIDDR